MSPASSFPRASARLMVGLFVSLAALASAPASVASAGDAPAASAAAPIPLTDFLAHDAFGMPKISPSGKYLAAVVDREDGNALVVVRIDDLVPVHESKLPGKRRVGSFAWIGDDRLLFSGAIQLGSLAAPSATGDWYAVDADGGRPVEVVDFDDRFWITGTQGALDEYTFLARAAEPGTVLMQVDSPMDEGTKSELVAVDTVTGKRKTLVKAPQRDCAFVLGADRNVAYADCAVERTRQGTYVEWQELYRRDADGGWTRVNRTADSGIFVAPIGAAPDGRMYAWRGDYHVPDAFGTLAADGSFNPLFRSADADVYMLLYGPDQRGVFGVVTMSGLPKVELVDGSATAAQDAAQYLAVAKGFPGRFVEYTSASRDGARIIVGVYGGAEPAEYYLLDRATGQARFLVRTHPKLDRARLARVKPFEFAARDGLPLHGYLTVPRGEAPEHGWPLVVLPHGGPMKVRDDWFFDGEAQLLASRGYLVLKVNYRGSDGFGQDFESKGYGQWGAAMQDDLVDATRWAAANANADADRVCLYGASYGGYAALEGAARDPGMYRCAAGYVGVYDLPRVARDMHDYPDLKRWYDLSLGRDRAHLKDRSPVNLAARITVPVFLAAGKEDGTAPVGYTEAMRDALVAAGHPPEEVIIEPKEGHGFYAEAANLNLYTKLLAFLDRHIGPSAVTATAATASTSSTPP